MFGLRAVAQHGDALLGKHFLIKNGKHYKSICFRTSWQLHANSVLELCPTWRLHGCNGFLTMATVSLLISTKGEHTVR